MSKDERDDEVGAPGHDENAGKVTARELYQILIQCTIHAENIRWSRFNHFLVFQGILIAGWVALQTTKGTGCVCLDLVVLAVITVVGLASGVLWGRLGVRGSDLLDHYMNDSVRIELDENLWSPEIAHFYPQSVVRYDDYLETYKRRYATYIPGKEEMRGKHIPQKTAQEEGEKQHRKPENDKRRMSRSRWLLKWMPLTMAGVQAVLLGVVLVQATLLIISIIQGCPLPCWSTTEQALPS